MATEGDSIISEGKASILVPRGNQVFYGLKLCLKTQTLCFKNVFQRYWFLAQPERTRLWNPRLLQNSALWELFSLEQKTRKNEQENAQDQCYSCEFLFSMIQC